MHKSHNPKPSLYRGVPPGFAVWHYRQINSVTTKLQELRWEDLQSRQDQIKVIMMCKIVNNLVEIPAGQYQTATGVATRGHNQRLLPIYCYINVYEESFFPSTDCLPMSYEHHVWTTSQTPDCGADIFRR